LQPLTLNISIAKIVFKLLSVPFKLYLFIILLLFFSLPGNATDNSFVAGSVDKKIIDTAFFAQNDSLLTATDTV